MVEKVKNFNWLIVSVVVLFLANSSMVYAISKVSLNTKSMDNSSILLTYCAIGILALCLYKLNNVAINRLSKN